MKRLIAVTTALAVLGVAGAAYASTSINTYSLNMGFTSKAAGTAAKPVPTGFSLDIKAMGTNGNRTAVLSDLKTKIYGLKADGKDFPTCSMNQIANAHTDAGCPKGAEVATGYITATLGASTDFTQAGSACNPVLDVWNAGQGKLVFFFVDTPAHQCLGTVEKTGDVGPYPATDKTEGKYLVLDVPVPSYVNSPIPGLSGSLTGEHLTWFKSTKTVKGKTVAAFSSIGSQGKKRPYSQTFTASLPTTGQTQIATLSGAAPAN